MIVVSTIETYSNLLVLFISTQYYQINNKAKNDHLFGFNGLGCFQTQRLIYFGAKDNTYQNLRNLKRVKDTHTHRGGRCIFTYSQGVVYIVSEPLFK